MGNCCCQLTSRRSIFGMPGVVSLMAQLMMTFGVIRNRGEPPASSIDAVPMILIPRGDQGSIVARSSMTRVACGFF